MPYSYLFRDDYSEGAHPNILKALCDNNVQQEAGYGADSFSQEAESLIKKIIKKPEAKVYFVASGTQANLVSIASFLKPYESIITADTGHPNNLEAGAIEATGHKLNIATGIDGRLTPESILKIVQAHTDEHMVKPKAVFISQATELGTIYSKKQLQEISALCKENGLYLYIDGARLGSALMAKNADYDLQTIANLSDMFYIGGTKNGALYGEAIVIVNPALQENFRYHLKQRGALLAKGRGVGIQFVELFKNNLYYENAKHANDMSEKLSIGIKQCGYNFLSPSCTNQIFPILPNDLIKHLEKKFGFFIWSSIAESNNSAIRLCTSWATLEESVESFISDLKHLS